MARVEPDRAPCIGDYRFLQSGDEDEQWHTRPDALAAVTICHTRCPRPALVDCARRALAAGNLPDWEDGRVSAPASGVIAAGIACHGDDATAAALRDIIAEPEPCCTGCGREFGAQVQRYARGLCSGCHSANRRAGLHTSVRQPRPTHCTRCARPVVGYRDPVPPGHVRYHGGGRCKPCQQRSIRENRTAA